MKTTLNKLKEKGACTKRYKHLLNCIGKTKADDKDLSIKEILNHNGIKDAVWALRAVDGYDREIRLFSADCAEMVLHIFEKELPNDKRPKQVIEDVKKFANGEITRRQLDAARAAAWDAAWDEIEMKLKKYL